MLDKKPTPQKIEQVLSHKLAMVVTQDYERILIGPEEAIRRRLEYLETEEIIYDEKRPFGTILLTMDKDDEREWNEALFHLREAQRRIHSINLCRLIKHEYAPELEDLSYKILNDKFLSADPLSKFVSARIWYGYQLLREKLPKSDCSIFLDSMEHLIRPFSYTPHYAIDRARVTASNALFRRVKPFRSCDSEINIRYVKNTPDLKYILVDRSLIPLEKYYTENIFGAMTKYLLRCKICNQLFFADTLKFGMCSDTCRSQSHIEILVQRSHDERISSVDRMINSANSHWNRRLKKIIDSGLFSLEEVQIYEKARNNYLADRKSKRKDLKKENISLQEFRDWLLLQENEAQKLSDALWAAKNGNT